jgi:hypothetical protein
MMPGVYNKSCDMTVILARIINLEWANHLTKCVESANYGIKCFRQMHQFSL